MKMRMLIFVAAAALLSAAPVLAQSFPSRRIDLIVPYTPGGPADTTARVLADLMRKSLSQPVVILNKPGAGTAVAASAYVGMPADGYTLFQCTSSTFSNTLVDKNAPYSTAELYPVALLNQNPFVFTVPKALPVNSMAEFVAFAKANPGKFNYGVVGTMSVDELQTRMFLKSNGIDLVPVAYNGFAPVLQALLVNTVQLFFDAYANSIPQHRAGAVKILGVAAAERFSSSPEIPTMREQGFPIVNGSWVGLCALVKTPKPILAQIATAASEAIGSTEYQSRMKGLDLSPPASSSPEQFSAFIKGYSAGVKTMMADLGL